MKKWVIFDLWYTLIYLDEGWKTFNLLREEFKIPKNEWIKNVKQLFLCNDYGDEKSFVMDFSKTIGISLDVKKYASILHTQREYDLKHIKIYPDVMPVIVKIKELGHDIGLITNQCTFYESWFYNSPLCEQIGMTVFSNKVGIRKPNPEIYKIFTDKAGVDPKNCMMIGDSIEQDVMMPKRLGMSAIHLDRYGNTPGGIKTLDEALFKLI